MKRSIKELEKIAKELRETIQKMSQIGEEGSCMIQEGFKKVMEALRIGASILYELPDRLLKIIHDLKEFSQPDGHE